MSTIPPDVQVLLCTVTQGLIDLLGQELVGLYVRGSLATGDFDPETSDVDLFAVVGHPLRPALFDRLRRWHEALAHEDIPYVRELEITYVDRENARRFRAGRRFPTLERGGALRWTQHGANWVLERWVVREHGIPLVGPEPSTLIDPITPAQMRAAVRERMRDWMAWAEDETDPDWAFPLSHKAYVVETMCRALYTTEHGTWMSKPAAVAWAQSALPEPWRTWVKRSRAWRRQNTPAPELNPVLRQFILWTATQVGARA